jgi:hypothetical protein
LGEQAGELASAATEASTIAAPASRWWLILALYSAAFLGAFCADARPTPAPSVPELPVPSGPSHEQSAGAASEENSDGGASYLDLHAGDSLLLVATLDGTVHALSGATGELLWSLDAGGPLVSSSAFDTSALIAAEADDTEGAAAEGRVPASGASSSMHGLHSASQGVPRLVHKGEAGRAARDGGGSASGWATVADAESARRTASAAVAAEEAEPAMDDATGSELEVVEEELLVLPGLDGSIFLVDAEADELTKLTEHTVQDLVAAPTIFADGGLLLGSKTAKLFALQPRTGLPIYYATADSANDGAAERVEHTDTAPIWSEKVEAADTLPPVGQPSKAADARTGRPISYASDGAAGKLEAAESVSAVGQSRARPDTGLRGGQRSAGSDGECAARAAGGVAGGVEGVVEGGLGDGAGRASRAGKDGSRVADGGSGVGEGGSGAGTAERVFAAEAGELLISRSDYQVCVLD